MKKMILSSLLLASTIFASEQITLYKNFVLGSEVKKTYKEASPEDYNLLPAKPGNGLKYYKSKTGEVLLFKNNKLAAVATQKETKDTFSEEINKVDSSNKFIGGTVVHIDKKKNVLKLRKLVRGNKNQLIKVFEGQESKANVDSFLAGTGVFKDSKKRTLLIYTETFKYDKNCKKCDFLDSSEKGLKAKSFVIKVYSE